MIFLVSMKATNGMARHMFIGLREGENREAVISQLRRQQVAKLKAAMVQVADAHAEAAARIIAELEDEKLTPIDATPIGGDLIDLGRVT